MNSPLALRLGLVDVVPPDIYAMSPNQHGIGIRILFHSLLKILGQILLMRGVLNDRDPERVMIPQVALLRHPPPEALDLLDVVDLKDFILTWTLGLEQQRDEHGPLGVRVDAAAGVAAGEGCEEEGRALGGLVAWGGAEIGARVLEGVLVGVDGEDVDVGVLHQFLLDA